MVTFPLTLKGDITRLNECMGVYATRLKIDPRIVVRQQAGILSRELAQGAAPASKQELDRNIEKDLRRVYSPAPRRMIPLTHRRGKGFVWIMATPAVVTGVFESDYRIEDSAEDMSKMFRRTAPRGNRYIHLGRKNRKKGVQSAQLLDRIVVQRGVYNQFLAGLKKRGGILGGSWVVAWPVLQPKGAKPPAYKFRHVQDGTARGTYIDGLGIPGHPRFSLVNRATGCTHPRQLEMLRGKLVHRALAMTADMKNLLRGAYKRAGFKHA
jgi:hypothetical protein